MSSRRNYYYLNGVVVTCFACFLMSCGDSKKTAAVASFTKADSLTETYLALQDSILQAWNLMINDDNGKIKTMHNLVHALMVSENNPTEDLISIERRLEELVSLRYDQETMVDPVLVDEYDFASSSLVSEIISIASVQRDSKESGHIQSLIDSITSADQRVNRYREEYDYIITKFNAFIERNKDYLKDMDPKQALKKKPVFQMTEEE